MINESIEFFNEVNKAECHILNLKRDNKAEYNRLRVEAASIEPQDIDEVIFDCVFVEEPWFVRYVLDNVDVSKVRSDYEIALKKTEGLKLRFWRDFLRGDEVVEEHEELLTLNYFTLYAGRVGRGPADTVSLNNFSGMKERFISEKNLAKIHTFYNESIVNYKIPVERIGDVERSMLENSNTYLEAQIAKLEVV